MPNSKSMKLDPEYTHMCMHTYPHTHTHTHTLTHAKNIQICRLINSLRWLLLLNNNNDGSVPFSQAFIVTIHSFYFSTPPSSMLLAPWVLRNNN